MHKRDELLSTTASIIERPTVDNSPKPEPPALGGEETERVAAEAEDQRSRKPAKRRKATPPTGPPLPLSEYRYLTKCQGLRYLNDAGFPIGTATWTKLTSPGSTGKDGPVCCGYWGRRPLFRPTDLIAWAEGRLRPTADSAAALADDSWVSTGRPPGRPRRNPTEAAATP